MYVALSTIRNKLKVFLVGNYNRAVKKKITLLTELEYVGLRKVSQLQALPFTLKRTH